MRAIPRTWPSTRARPALTDFVVFSSMLVRYPRRVYRASLKSFTRTPAMQDPHAGHHQAGHAHAPTSAPAPGPAPGKAIDPVCGMSVTIEGAKHRAEHDGEPY